jgi:hypothetical protein
VRCRKCVSDWFPLMADFALWATACETSLWSAGTFARAYAGNRRVAIEDAIDADPVAACVRELMVERPSWTGSAADLLRASADYSRSRIGTDRTGWPRNPRALAGRLRRAQSLLRAMGIELGFAREGRAGSRMIRISTTATSTTVSTVSTVSSAGDYGPGSGQPRPRPADDVCGDNLLCDFPCPIEGASVTAADDADGADANTHFAPSVLAVRKSPDSL